MRFQVAAAIAISFALSSSVSNGQEAVEPATAPASPATPQPFTPGLADMMNMLIAPRHLKLYYAGSERNWELAAFELREVGNALRRTQQTIPHYHNNDVGQAITAIMKPAMLEVEKAIAAADSKRFAKTYSDLTAACNSCHTFLEHPFIIMKVPDSSANTLFPDQDFKPPVATQ